MDGSCTDWLPGSPFRIPAWRWARACWLHETARPTCPHLDDDWIDRALGFLVARNRSSACAARRRPSRPDPAILAALDLSREQPPHRRWELEARLLTDEPLSEVARKCLLTEPLVTAYEALFFNVKGHLKARDWIASRVLGANGEDSAAPDNRGRLWKLFAFHGGPLILDVVMAVTMDRPLPDSVRASNVDSPAYADACLRARCQFLINAVTAGSDAELAALITVRNQFDRLERSTTDTAPKATALSQLAESFFKGMAPRKRPSSSKISPSHARKVVRGRRRTQATLQDCNPFV